MDLVFGMRLFTRVVETENFSEVARQFDMNPSSVSRQIAALEDSLKTQLVNRTTRKISLTEAGRLYYERARQILQDIDDANLSVSSLRTVPSGQLRLNMPVTFGSMYILPLLPTFAKMYPDVSLDITMSDSFVDLVEEGVDLAIRVGRMHDSSLVARRLARNERIVVGTKTYFKRFGRPRSPEDLSHHNCLLYKGDRFKPQWAFYQEQNPTMVSVSGSFRANNAMALLHACQSSLGLAYLPTWLSGPAIAKAQLEPLFAGYRSAPANDEVGIYAVYAQSKHLSAKVRVFLDFLIEQFQPAPPWQASTDSIHPLR